MGDKFKSDDKNLPEFNFSDKHTALSVDIEAFINKLADFHKFTTVLFCSIYDTRSEIHGEYVYGNKDRKKLLTETRRTQSSFEDKSSEDILFHVARKKQPVIANPYGINSNLLNQQTIKVCKLDQDILFVPLAYKENIVGILHIEGKGINSVYKNNCLDKLFSNSLCTLSLALYSRQERYARIREEVLHKITQSITNCHSYDDRAILLLTGLTMREGLRFNRAMFFACLPNSSVYGIDNQVNTIERHMNLLGVAGIGSFNRGDDKNIRETTRKFYSPTDYVKNIKSVCNSTFNQHIGSLNYSLTENKYADNLAFIAKYCNEKGPCFLKDISADERTYRISGKITLSRNAVIIPIKHNGITTAFIIMDNFYREYLCTSVYFEKAKKYIDSIKPFFFPFVQFGRGTDFSLGNDNIKVHDINSSSTGCKYIYNILKKRKYRSIFIRNVDTKTGKPWLKNILKHINQCGIGEIEKGNSMFLIPLSKTADRYNAERLLIINENEINPRKIWQYLSSKFINIEAKRDSDIYNSLSDLRAIMRGENILDIKEKAQDEKENSIYDKKICKVLDFCYFKLNLPYTSIVFKGHRSHKVFSQFQDNPVSEEQFILLADIFFQNLIKPSYDNNSHHNSIDFISSKQLQREAEHKLQQKLEISHKIEGLCFIPIWGKRISEEISQAKQNDTFNPVSNKKSNSITGAIIIPVRDKYLVNSKILNYLKWLSTLISKEVIKELLIDSLSDLVNTTSKALVEEQNMGVAFDNLVHNVVASVFWFLKGLDKEFDNWYSSLEYVLIWYDNKEWRRIHGRGEYWNRILNNKDAFSVKTAEGALRAIMAREAFFTKMDYSDKKVVKADIDSRYCFDEENSDKSYKYQQTILQSGSIPYENGPFTKAYIPLISRYRQKTTKSSNYQPDELGLEGVIVLINPPDLLNNNNHIKQLFKIFELVAIRLRLEQRWSGLANLAFNLNQSSNLSEAMKIFVNSTKHLFRIPDEDFHVSIVHYDRLRDKFRYEYVDYEHLSHDASTQFTKDKESKSLSRFLLDQYNRNSKRSKIDEVPSVNWNYKNKNLQPVPPPSGQYSKDGIGAKIAVLLVNEGKCLGSFGIWTKSRKYEFSELEVGRAKVLANLLAATYNRFITLEESKLRESMQAIEGLAHRLANFMDQVSYELNQIGETNHSRTKDELLSTISDTTILHKKGRNILTAIQNSSVPKERLKSIDVNEFCNFISKSTGKGIKIKELVIDSLKERHKYLIKVDKFRIVELIDSLILDSRKFIIQKSSLRINIAYTVSDTDKTLKLIYKDNGPGIPLENKDKIFEPYYSSIGTTGLGLSIAKQIMESHSGEIFEDGEYGHGVKFTILFPLSKKGEV